MLLIMSVPWVSADDWVPALQVLLSRSAFLLSEVEDWQHGICKIFLQHLLFARPKDSPAAQKQIVPTIWEAENTAGNVALQRAEAPLPIKIPV